MRRKSDPPHVRTLDSMNLNNPGEGCMWPASKSSRWNNSYTLTGKGVEGKDRYRYLQQTSASWTAAAPGQSNSKTSTKLLPDAVINFKLLVNWQTPEPSENLSVYCTKPAHWVLQIIMFILSMISAWASNEHSISTEYVMGANRPCKAKSKNLQICQLPAQAHNGLCLTLSGVFGLSWLLVHKLRFDKLCSMT